jgi:acyl dehydratase
MPIDVEKVVGAELPAANSSWDQDDVILYHLGLGAGVPQTDPNELEYTYEQNLKVLPSYGVQPVFSALWGLAGLDGLDINFAMLLHGEQDIEIHKPIPTSAEVKTTAKVTDLFDKGKGALLVLECVTSNGDGEPLFTNKLSAFLRGEGGFGGESGPAPGNEPPDREPDFEVERATLPQQALLFRLSGDKNPLHADPAFAQMGGFDVPILHGLCSFGIVCKAAVDEGLGGDVTQVSGYQVRFAGVLFPGETLVIRGWKEDGRILLDARCKERDTPVISNAALRLR